MTLTKPQQAFLQEASSRSGVFSTSYYPPAIKLASLGLIEDVDGRWYTTNIGRAALRGTLADNEIRSRSTINPKYKLISPLLQSEDAQAQKQAIAILEPFLREAGGNVVKAARMMKVSHRQLCRWVATSDELRDLVDRLRRERQP